MSVMEKHFWSYGIEEGQKRERERIVKLLEEFYDGNLWRQTDLDKWEGFNVQELIELIKGKAE